MSSNEISVVRFSAREGSGVFSTRFVCGHCHQVSFRFSAREGSGVFSTGKITWANVTHSASVSAPVRALGSFLRQNAGDRVLLILLVSAPVRALGSFLPTTLNSPTAVARRFQRP